MPRKQVSDQILSQHGHFQHDLSEQRGAGVYSCSNSGSTSGLSGLILTVFILMLACFYYYNKKAANGELYCYHSFCAALLSRFSHSHIKEKQILLFGI